MKFFQYSLFILFCFVYVSQQSFSIDTETNIVTLWEKKANQGNAYAQFILGGMYLEGNGLPQDYSKAFEWFTKAANQNNKEAQFNLGILYYEGKGIPQDKIKAEEYIKKSCLNGLNKACNYYSVK